MQDPWRQPSRMNSIVRIRRQEAAE
jgi:hypothetical protein